MTLATLAAKIQAFDGDAPLERARTIPAAWYTDDDVYALERRAVFARSWQMVGRRDQVEALGSYVTATIAGEPVVVLRGEDGELRGFFNVCRHRAAPLLTEPCGTATKLRCRYHGWTYDLAGRLRGTPEFDGVADFRKEDNGLVPIHVALWGPWLWVHVEPPTQTVEQFLAPLPEWTAQRKALDGLRWAGRSTFHLKCNWKVFVDNYLDGGYHVNTVHPGLAGVLDYTQYRTMLHENCNVQTAPLKPDDRPDDGGAATRTRTGDLAAYWWLYPNLMLNVYEGVADTNLVLPDGVDRCIVHFDYWFARLDGNEAFVTESKRVAERIQDEDIGICEEVQRGLGSRCYDTGRFSVKRESGGYHFHRLLAKRLREVAFSQPEA